MTGLFGKITDQMIVNCKDCITGKDSMDALWEKVREKELADMLPTRALFAVDTLNFGYHPVQSRFEMYLALLVASPCSTSTSSRCPFPRYLLLSPHIHAAWF